MKRTTLALSLLFMTAFALNATNDKTETSKTSDGSTAHASVVLAGSVSDFASGEMLAGATVEVVGTDIKAYTDFDGMFVIEDLPEGSYNLIISYISYDKSYVESVDVRVGADNRLSINLSR